MTKATRRSIFADRLREFPEFAFGDDEPFQRRGRWTEFFRRRIGPTFGGRIVFEIGCADAAFISRIAAKHPDVGFIGLDWKAKSVYDGARRVSELGSNNVALLRGRAQDVLQILEAGEVDEVWVFHPDPCDRDVELRNRLIAPPFLADVRRILRDRSSVLALKTDHPGYYQWVLGLLGLPEPDWTTVRTRTRDLMPAADIPAPSDAIRRDFEVVMNSADYWQDPAALAHTAARAFAGEVTTYESRFLKKRLPIYYVELRPK
jgi:tRNA G46 methylase TrmB